MKDYPQFQKIVSVMMIFILLIQVSGCVSSRSGTTIPATEIPVSQKYYYIIHGQKLNYRIENVTVVSGILSGKINVNSSVGGNKIHIYLPSDSVMKISTEMILDIPLDDITKVEIVKISIGKTILLAAGCTVVLLGLIGIASMRNWTYRF